MKKIGLTGGIGSGKSVVAEIFQILGIPVFNSDIAGRQVLDESEVVRKAVSEIVGKEVYASGKADRKAIAEIVFNDKGKLEALNKIIHPAVATKFEEFCNAHRTSEIVIKEAAILMEIGDKSVEKLILVTAPEQVRLDRVSKRDGISHEEVKLRIKNQMSDEERSKRADHVIVNDGKEMIIPQILKLIERLRQQ